MVPMSAELMADAEVWRGVWDEIAATLIFGPELGPGREELRKVRLTTNPRRRASRGVLSDSFLAHRCDY